MGKKLQCLFDQNLELISFPMFFLSCILEVSRKRIFGAMCLTTLVDAWGHFYRNKMIPIVVPEQRPVRFRPCPYIQPVYVFHANVN